MIPTTVAGSLPKPTWLAEPERLWAAWRQQGDDLVAAQRDAALMWIKLQEDAGIDIVSDGEQFHQHFVHGFLQSIGGIDWNLMTTMGIRDNRYEAEVPTVTEPVQRPKPVHVGSAAFCRAHTKHKLKVALPGPMTICDTIADSYYGSRPDMAMAFADLLNTEARELAGAGVDVIQFDEPAFNAFAGDVIDWGIAALNRAVEGVNCATAVHICYGYGIQQNIDWKKSLGAEWRQYEDIFPALNNSMIDQVSLECANSRVPMSLIGLLPDKQILVGVIDVASEEIESPETVAATLQAALEFADVERVQACTNCGMVPLPRPIAEKKLLVLGAGTQLMRARLIEGTAV